MGAGVCEGRIMDEKVREVTGRRTQSDIGGTLVFTLSKMESQWRVKGGIMLVDLRFKRIPRTAALIIDSKGQEVEARKLRGCWSNLGKRRYWLRPGC